MKKFAGIVLAATMGGAITLGLYKVVEPATQEVIRVEHTNAVPAHSSRFGGVEVAPFDFTGPAETVMPGVVHIKSTQLRPAGNAQQMQIPDLFRDFFGDQLPDQDRSGRPRPAIGTGSGVIISGDGYIVTNNHVIEGADDVEVSLNDNRTYKAEIVGTDPSTDLALLKIDEADLEAVQIGNSDATKVGQWVLA
ncbi:MAG: trypsin-like peptidase domain-containing protein, partial [Bacteroidota bacterium]